MTVRHAWLCLVVAACSDGHHDAPPLPAPPTSAPIDVRVAADAATPDAHPIDVVPEGVDAQLVANKHSYGLGFGYAVPLADRLYITLTTSKIDCAHKPSYGSPKGVDAIADIQIPSGPGGHYFANSWIGVDVLVTLGHERTHLERAGLVLDTEYMNGTAGMVRVDLPPKAAPGTHLRGELDIAGANLLGDLQLTGHFDVEVCAAIPPADVEQLPPYGPRNAAHGWRGGKELATARTVHAIVAQGSSTVDNAIDVSLHRANGDRPYIAELAFYAEEHVPCRGLGDETKPGATLIAEGSTFAPPGSPHPIIHVVQPSSIALYLGTGKIEEVWPGAVVLHDIDTTDGARITGSIWAMQAGYSDVKGTWGGDFEATVCNPPPPK